jgi:alkylhydroperoxidase family enzyme
MVARIAPANAPFGPEIQAALDATMRGKPPLALFTTLARDQRLFRKFFGGGLLDRGHLAKRHREIVILRTTALCGSEYEWGVHVTTFSEAAKFTTAQIQSLYDGQATDPCWELAEEGALIRMCDALHRHCTLASELWEDLSCHFSEEGMIELLMLAGFYRTVSYLTNALQLPLESDAARFPVHAID